MEAKNCIRERMLWLDKQEEMRNLNQSKSEERQDLKDQLNMILSQEEIIWGQIQNSIVEAW